MKFYDCVKDRLVYIREKATRDFWEKCWDRYELEKVIKSAARNRFALSFLDRQNDTIPYFDIHVIDIRYSTFHSSAIECTKPIVKRSKARPNGLKQFRICPLKWAVHFAVIGAPRSS
jgi:hypothetical protein